MALHPGQSSWVCATKGLLQLESIIVVAYAVAPEMLQWRRAEAGELCLAPRLRRRLVANPEIIGAAPSGSDRLSWTSPSQRRTRRLQGPTC